MKDESTSLSREDNESPFLNEFFSRSLRRRRGLGEDTFTGEASYSTNYAPGTTELVDPELSEEWGEDSAGEAPYKAAPYPMNGEGADEDFAGEESEDPESSVASEDEAVEHFAVARTPALPYVALLPPVLREPVGIYILATSEEVHESLTKQAARYAGVPYDHRLEAGCRWPDVPCSRESSGVEAPDFDRVGTCYDAFIRYLANKKAESPNRNSVTFRSHEGDLQIWHSMSLTGKGTTRQVRDRIVKQIGEWYEKGRRDTKNGLFHVARALHTIQDSFSRSHTWRAETNTARAAGAKYRRPKKGEILAFQDYNAQDGDKHGTADHKTSAGYGDALAASIDILKYFKKKEPFNPKVYDYLIKNVYILAPGYESLPAGGTHPRYAKEENKIKREYGEMSYESDLEDAMPAWSEVEEKESVGVIDAGELDPEVSDLTERVFQDEGSSFEEETTIRWTKCFLQEDVEKVRKVYVENASAASSNSTDRCSCIVMLNVALGQLLPLKLKQHPARGTSTRRVQMARLTTESVDKAMRQLRQMNFALGPIEINFFDRRNRTAGTLKPERLKESVRDKVLANSSAEGCWFAFGLSVMDGYHSVLLLVDRTTADAKIYWLDQFSNGLNDDVTDSLDQRLIQKTQSWWQSVMDEKHKGYKTTIRLWPLRKPA